MNIIYRYKTTTLILAFKIAREYGFETKIWPSDSNYTAVNAGLGRKLSSTGDVPNSVTWFWSMFENLFSRSLGY